MKAKVMEIKAVVKSKELVDIYFNGEYWTTISRESVESYWRGINHFTLFSEIDVKFVGVLEIIGQG